jgi:hypothetical protein
LRARVRAAFFAAAERLDELRRPADFFVARLAGAGRLLAARLRVELFFVELFFAGDFRADVFFADFRPDVFLADLLADVFFADVFFADFLPALLPRAPPVCLLTVAHARFCAVFFDTPRFS